MSVNGYSANAIGDLFIVSNGPYTGITGFSSWNINVKVNNVRYTDQTVNITSGDTSFILTTGGNLYEMFSNGDSVVVNDTSFVIDNIYAVNAMDVTVAPTFTQSNVPIYFGQEPNNYFTYEFRWSTDGDNWSIFRPLDNKVTSSSFLGSIFIGDEPVHIDVRATVVNIFPGNELIIFGITLDPVYVLDSPKSPVDCSILPCSDPFSPSGSADILLDCVTSTNTFNPYAVNKSVDIYKQLGNLVSNMFGHTVSYYRTEPDSRSSDVTLMEYSLHNVKDNQQLKILVPDNEFPEEANMFDIFGMEFADFEVHIVADAFISAFGVAYRPRSRDYLFIPLTNKMYEVSSVSVADEFNATKSYWRVKLIKYQDRSSVIKGAFESATDSLITGIEEVFGEEIRDEQTKTTKPMQYQTVSHVLEDGIRTYISKGLNIIDEAIINNYVTVSQHHYDLSGVLLNSTSLEYASQSGIKPGEHLAVSMWFKPLFLASDTTAYTLISDSQISNGFNVSISSTDVLFAANGQTYNFQHNIVFDTNKWYAIILSVNNFTLTISVDLYSMNTDPSGNNTIINSFAETQPLSSIIEWTPPTGTVFNLVGGKLKVAGIRVFNKPIDNAQHENVLNQYVVRDNQYSLVIDNALPSLLFQKFKNAR